MRCGRDDLPIQGTGKLSLLSLPQVALYISGIAEPVLLPRPEPRGAVSPAPWAAFDTAPGTAQCLWSDPEMC